LLRLSDARVANSRAGLRSRGFGENKNGNYIIYNGFDMGRCDKAHGAGNGRPELSWKGKKAVVMVAEFSDYKDYPTFIRAAQIVRQVRQDVVFVAVGGGKNLETCRAAAASIGDGIQFLGERKDIESIINSARLGILCTRTEGISNSVMEYMAAGKPVVVTDGGGSCEIVADGENGFLVPQGDAAAVAEKIQILLDDPVLADKMGLAGKHRLQRDFSLERLADDTIRMYEDVLRKRR
jgi:glycosyltransferase involved in cell wall biosynthesis